MRPDRERKSAIARVMAAQPAAAILAAVAAGASAPGCTGNGPEAEIGDSAAASGTVEAETTDSGGATGTLYQRSVVFVDVSRETAMFVSWDFENLTGNDNLHRVLRGWLGRGGEWKQFVDEEWVTPPTRTPWRILPRGAARLVVGLDDVLREIYYQEGIADLSVRPAEAIAKWNGQRGDTYQVQSGFASLSGVEYPGLVVDTYIPRANDSDQPSEWGLLVGDGPLYLLLADVNGAAAPRAWALHDAEEKSWPTVTLSWADTRSFERARRNIPVQWRFRSDDGELAGEIESVSSHLQAIDGEGPILPVLGVYEVEGQVTVGETRVAVKGFLRHFQR